MKGEIPIEQLDKLLKWFDEGRASSGIDEAYRRFNDVWMKHPTDLPDDPFSAEYAARYFDIYRRVSARETYDPAINERAEFDPQSGALRPFPFQGGSTKLAGEHFGYMARLLDMMDVPPGGKSWRWASVGGTQPSRWRCSISTSPRSTSRNATSK